MGKRLHQNITIRGKVYPTAQAAAAALGVVSDTIHRAIREGRLDLVGLQRPESTRQGLPVRIRGRVYANAAAAAAVLKLTPNAVLRAVREGREDRVGLRQRGRPAGCPVVIGPHRFPSMRAASLALGFERSYVWWAFRKSATARARVLAAAMALDAKASRSAMRVANMIDVPTPKRADRAPERMAA